MPTAAERSQPPRRPPDRRASGRRQRGAAPLRAAAPPSARSRRSARSRDRLARVRTTASPRAARRTAAICRRRPGGAGSSAAGTRCRRRCPCSERSFDQLASAVAMPGIRPSARPCACAGPSSCAHPGHLVADGPRQAPQRRASPASGRSGLVWVVAMSKAASGPQGRARVWSAMVGHLDGLQVVRRHVPREAGVDRVGGGLPAADAQRRRQPAASASRPTATRDQRGDQPRRRCTAGEDSVSGRRAVVTAVAGASTAACVGGGARHGSRAVGALRLADVLAGWL